MTRLTCRFLLRSTVEVSYHASQQACAATAKGAIIMEIERSAESGSKSTQNAASLLRKSRERILKQWAERARDNLSAARLQSTPALYNAIPSFLSQIADTLDRESSVKIPCSDAVSICKEHGEQRAGLSGYSLRPIIVEYGILQDTILDVLEEQSVIDRRSRNIILHSIQQGITEASTEYTRIQDSLREQFIAILTHDLKNPLSAAKTSAQMILRVLEHPDKCETLASRAVGSIKRIEGMIQDLLDTFQIRAGRPLPIDKQINDLNKTAQEAVDELTTVHGTRFILKTQGAAIANFCSDGVRRSIENLANNAVKYGDAQTPITLTVSNTERGSVEISVHNHGNPLIADEQAKLFLPFHRAPFAQTSGKKGWGLGLTLVQGVAQAHGGNVKVDSSPEAGTTFTIQFPNDLPPPPGTSILGH